MSLFGDRFECDEKVVGACVLSDHYGVTAEIVF